MKSSVLCPKSIAGALFLWVLLASGAARAQAACGYNLMCNATPQAFAVSNSYNSSSVPTIYGYAAYGYGVYGNTNGSAAGVRGTSAGGNGVLGESTGLNGVQGTTTAYGTAGVYGATYNEYLGYAIAARNYSGCDSCAGAGVFIDSAAGGDAYGLYQYGGGTNYFSGSISKPGGSFEIDHPIDPANKLLFHSFVESPDMKNIYDGVALLDAKGTAAVALPSYFEALNHDFRYQLTCIGAHAPVYVAKEIRGNQFVIAGGTPGLKVSWQVTGTRHDAWAKAHPIYPEMWKRDPDRGKYLHAKEAGMPGEMQIKNKTPFHQGAEAKWRALNDGPSGAGGRR